VVTQLSSRESNANATVADARKLYDMERAGLISLSEGQNMATTLMNDLDEYQDALGKEAGYVEAADKMGYFFNSGIRESVQEKYPNKR
jgi:hypothetical protein